MPSHAAVDPLDTTVAARLRDRQRADFDAAERELSKRDPGSITFRCVSGGGSGALPFFYTKRRLLQGANAAQPRTYRTRDGEEVTMSVDGGRGGDIHGTLAVLEDIDRAIGRAIRERARRSLRGGRPPGIPPERLRWVLDAYHGGADEPAPGWFPGCARSLAWTQDEIAQHLGCSQQTVSATIGRLESAIAAELRAAGLVL